MGFALYIGKGISWARGTHEYRPMGVAIISATDYFRARDFHPARRCPSRNEQSFQGYFASIGQMNDHLIANRRRTGVKSITRP